jgi:hypothetical protein
MGVPTLMYRNGDTADSLSITGDEVFDVILRVTKDGLSGDVTVSGGSTRPWKSTATRTAGF